MKLKRYRIINKYCAILLIIIVLVTVLTPLSYMFAQEENEKEESGNTVALTLWQVDSFEGGKGSRAQYLSNTAKDIFDGERIYVEVTSVSAQAVRDNFAAGNFPDILSYSSGFYGIENYIFNGSLSGTVWCRGGYCFLTLGENGDFYSVSAENTVVNEGKDNLACVAAALEDLYNASFASPTSAYVQLLSGKYKYLLGTQRDIYRLKTRGVAFSVKPVESFNDLYQYISVLTSSAEKYSACKRFIEGLTERSANLTSIGMFSDRQEIYTDSVSVMEKVDIKYRMNSLCSEEYVLSLKKYALEGDVNNLKKLLK